MTRPSFARHHLLFNLGRRESNVKATKRWRVLGLRLLSRF